MQDRLSRIELGPFDEVIDSLFDPFVPLAVIFEFGRDVVAQVVSLVLPDADHVGLEQRDLVECCTKAVEVLFFLVVIGLHPQDARCDAPHPQGGEFHAFAGRIEFPKVRLADRVAAAKFRDLTGSLGRWLP